MTRRRRATPIEVLIVLVAASWTILGAVTYLLVRWAQ